jgi:hypothetical protein
MLIEVNWNILGATRDSPSEPLEWDFFCECGRAACHEKVSATLDAYLARRAAGTPVLAPGHYESQLERARRLVADTEALKRQAQHQLNRAKRNLQLARRRR